MLVRSVFQEYSGFFLRSDGALKEKLTNGTPLWPNDDVITRYRKLNQLLSLFEDPYARLNERGLQEILYAMDTPDIRNTMDQVREDDHVDACGWHSLPWDEFK
ncbi:hypothetical protein BGZ65_004794 [Modicella reniformis]|uniref:Uncharacterized protein n=1 Tax=Modicella reniformis TaxID=1440133 RepID=A0A9P6STB5_9FUNG|nr:hypothetical protein BGZ65_004794 [Modicella reniformis]